MTVVSSPRSLQVVWCNPDQDPSSLQFFTNSALLVRPDGHIAWRAVTKELGEVDSKTAFQQLTEILQELKR